MATEVTFTNNIINGAISPEQRYQIKINPKGVIALAQITAEAAANLKENPSFAENIAREIFAVTKRHLAAGERVLHDGFCRFEFSGRGTFSYEDEPWDTARHAIVVSVIPYESVRTAAKDVVPANTLSPVAIQLLGAQDKTTYAQNELVKGHTLLVQGKNIRVTSDHEDEGFWLVKGDEAYKATVAANTAGTADLTFDEDLPAGEGYTLEIRGRAGLGLNRMLVTARITGITVKAA